MPNRIRFLGPAIAAALLCTAPAGAQEPADGVLHYEREVFTYERAGRRDPFRSLLDSAELGVRVEDLALRGVVYQSTPGRSVAVLEHAPNAKRYRVREGDVLGPIRIVSIHPRSIDVVVEELGVARRETLILKPSSEPRSE